jgi:uncharacterized membrane protein
MEIQFAWKEKIGPVMYITFRGKQYGFCACHHDPDRSVPFFGLEKYFCSRCLGIILGAVAGICLRVLHIQIPLLVALALMIPLVVDGGTQALDLRMSNNYLRLATGFLCGLGILLFPFS